MANEISLESLESNLVATMEEINARPTTDATFRVALLGDWSGRANRGLSASGVEPAQWLPLLIDRDNLDEVMERLGVRLRLPLTSSTSLALDFNKIEDFHPDRIFERAEIFQALRQTRERLRNSKTFAEEAAEVRKWLSLPETKTSQTKPVQPTALETSEAKPSGDKLLDQVLEVTGAPAGQPQRDRLAPDLRSLVEEIVRPHLLPDEAEQDSLIEAVDKAIGDQMRSILHHADFQSLEAAWRAIDFLVSGLETGTQLKLYLLDISFAEFQAALLAEDETEATGIYRLLVESSTETFGGEPWAMLAGNYVFDFTARHAVLLKRMSVIAERAVAPFVAAGTSRIVGCESLLAMEDPRDWQLVADAESKQAWDALRRLSSARYVGLALPRFLLRLPYGSETDTTEEFSFEEFGESPGPEHEWYLWANPAFAVAYLLAQAYLRSGWEMRPGECQEIEGLPLHVHKVDGETQIKPCAEVLMTVRVAEKVIDHGPMPLLTIKDTGTVRLGVVQSIALPATNLEGRWAP